MERKSFKRKELEMLSHKPYFSSKSVFTTNTCCITLHSPSISSPTFIFACRHIAKRFSFADSIPLSCLLLWGFFFFSNICLLFSNQSMVILNALVIIALFKFDNRYFVQIWVLLLFLQPDRCWGHGSGSCWENVVDLISICGSSGYSVGVTMATRAKESDHADTGFFFVPVSRDWYV